MHLNEVSKGMNVVVEHIDVNEQTKHRLRSLGMLRGTSVEVIQKKKSGTLVINLRGTRFALGKELSERIEVKE